MIEPSSFYYSDLFTAILLAWDDRAIGGLKWLLDKLLSDGDMISVMYTDEEWRTITLIIEEVYCG